MRVFDELAYAPSMGRCYHENLARWCEGLVTVLGQASVIVLAGGANGSLERPRPATCYANTVQECQAFCWTRMVEFRNRRVSGAPPGPCAFRLEEEEVGMGGPIWHIHLS